MKKKSETPIADAGQTIYNLICFSPIWLVLCVAGWNEISAFFNNL